MKEAAPEYERGDVNCDGEINLADVTTLISMALNQVAATPQSDINGDNVLGIGDVTILISRVLKGTW